MCIFGCSRTYYHCFSAEEGKDKEDYVNNTYKVWAPKRRSIACIIWPNKVRQGNIKVKMK